METGISIRRHGVFARISERPAGALIVGLLTAAICGGFGAIYGEIAAAVMAGLGIIVGAPLGAQMASSLHDNP